MIIKVDKEKCIGCGTCESVCPAVFGMKEGKAYVKKQSDDKCVKEAEEACPVDAISV
tara:strand:- start:1391 stop:1561 length:171 start_codon:yes stop_codon:yes gene_type:complete